MLVKASALAMTLLALLFIPWQMVKPAPEEPMSKPTYKVRCEFLNGVRDDDFLANLQSKFETYWRPRVAPGQEAHVEAKFRIIRAGKYADLEISKSTGNFIFDQGIKNAITWVWGALASAEPQVSPKEPVLVKVTFDCKGPPLPVIDPTKGFRITEGTIGGETEKPYLGDLARRIKRAWFPPRGLEDKVVVITFTLYQDGNTSNILVKSSSQSEPADMAALNAVRNAVPFRHLPQGSSNTVGIEATFGYRAQVHH